MKTTVLTPTAVTERYQFIDVLRGTALFGIVTANAILYSLYLHLPDSAKAEMPTHAVDRALDFLELALIEGKFYTIFSVLFGVGFSILMSRSRAKGIVFHRFFLRRVVFLFLFGAAHAVLLWHDDILQYYALCGALLLPFAGAGSRTILSIAVLALLSPIPIKMIGGIPTGFFADAQGVLFDKFGLTKDTVIETWTTGTYGDILRLNLAKWFSQATTLTSSGLILKIYGCFMLGFWLGRNEIHTGLESYRPILKRMAIWGTAIGLPLNLVFAATFDSGSWLEVLSATFAILPLSAAYASWLCLIYLGDEGPRRLRHFAPVGRMALTNYIGQSFLCTLVFYGTGLGLGGMTGPTLYLPIAFAVYGVQVVASRLWLERFSFGPLEWLWRMLTYGRWFSLAKGATWKQVA